jgi:hypothetical protein
MLDLCVRSYVDRRLRGDRDNDAQKKPNDISILEFWCTGILFYSCKKSVRFFRPKNTSTEKYLIFLNRF